MNAIAVNGITVVNETDVRGQALAALIQLYIPGFNVYYAFRNLGDNTEQISFPALFVDPSGMTAQMITTGKYHCHWSYDIMYFVIDNNAQDILSFASSAMEALMKLFSNNALGDISGAHTNKFKQYANPSGGMYWLNSEMRGMKIGRSFVNTGPDNKETSLMRVGWMQFEIEDVILK